MSAANTDVLSSPEAHNGMVPRLLKLPAELRQKIYKYYVPHDQLLRQHKQPALARVCRLFRYEVLPLWIPRGRLCCNLEIESKGSWAKEEKVRMFCWMERMGETFLTNLSCVAIDFRTSSRQTIASGTFTISPRAGEIRGNLIYDKSNGWTIQSILIEAFEKLVQASADSPADHIDGRLLINVIREVLRQRHSISIPSHSSKSWNCLYSARKATYNQDSGTYEIKEEIL